MTQVKQGEHPSVTVRELISWFGYSRRRTWVVGEVRRELRRLGLRTVPDLDWTYLDGEVVFLSAEKTTEHGATAEPQTSQISREISDQMTLSDSAVATVVKALDPTFRIGRLDIGKKTPISVSPDARIDDVIGIMLKNDFSQLPVMTTEREVKGLFSWRTLGSCRVWGRSCTYVREAMEQNHQVVTEDNTLFEVMDHIERHECVLVRDSTQKIRGIITPYDIAVTFNSLGESFLLLSEIENLIRWLIGDKFSREELIAVRDPNDAMRSIEKVTDLTLGEYVRLLQKPECWTRIGLQFDKTEFVKELERTRDIRNDVMHFDPEGIDEDDLKHLRDHVQYLRRLRKLKNPV